MPFAICIDANIIEISPVKQIVDASKKRKPNNFITSPLINLSEVSTTGHLKWEEFILHSNFTKYYEVIITEQNDINSILTAAVTLVYNGNPTTLVPNRTL